MTEDEFRRVERRLDMLADRYDFRTLEEAAVHLLKHRASHPNVIVRLTEEYLDGITKTQNS
jgi:hypothetical protein